jgi:hypothetical protein
MGATAVGDTLARAGHPLRPSARMPAARTTGVHFAISAAIRGQLAVLDVTEAMTDDAVRNWSSRSVMP